jgi:GR25 family glycosyltransferase involved in LPS biosynthesis
MKSSNKIFLKLLFILFILYILFILFNHFKYFEKFSNNYYKINGIDKIVWINLDRTVERKKHMESLLNQTNIPHQRISGIDGQKINVNKITNDLVLGKKMSLGEIGCTLSHIKSINSLKNEKGNYFMVCEDDIGFDNLVYFKKNDLNKIIKNAPKFDILMINKIYTKELNNTYEKWITNYNKNKKIWGTGCYIISKDGIQKICKICEYINDNQFKFNKNIYNGFNVADIYLYKLLNTWVYKYNFINTIEQTSLIHNNHLNYHKNSNLFNLNLIKENQQFL